MLIGNFFLEWGDMTQRLLLHFLDIYVNTAIGRGYSRLRIF